MSFYTYEEARKSHEGTGYRKLIDIEPATNMWLGESRILPITQHFIQVGFYVPDSILDEPLAKPFISTDPFGRNILILPRYYIQSGDFDGVQIGARKGSITMIDPEGVWATLMNYVGQWKNSAAGIGRSNMFVQFGWIGLKPKKDKNIEIQKIPAVLLKTGFGMDADGVITITLEFVESSEKLSSVIKFNTLDGMTLLNSDINKDLTKMSIHEICRYLCNSGKEGTDDAEIDTIKEQMENSGLFIDFDETYDVNPFGEEGKDIKIRFGDSLDSKIRELISHAMPDESTGSEKDKDGNPKFTYSYEMIDKINLEATDKSKPPFATKIRYGWRRTPTPEYLATLSTEPEKKKALGVGGQDPIDGPTLLWKKQSTDDGDKTLVSFDIDLKMLDYATGMMKGSLDKKLGSFRSEDWDNIVKVVEQVREKGTNEEKKMLSMTPAQMANSSTALPVLEYDARKWMSWGINDDEKTTIETIKEYNEIVANTNNNVDNQITTIIRNNVFKAKARIIGDPTFGTIYTMFKTVMVTDFTAVSEFAQFFNRSWLLTKVSHKIEEGAYWTDLELMALPMDDAVKTSGNTDALTNAGIDRRTI